MAKFVLTAGYVALNSTDLSSYCSSIQLQIEAESKETTTVGSNGWHEELSGIKSVSLSASGQWEAADASKVDDEAFGNFGTVNGVSACPATAADGELAWLTAFNRRQYQLFGAVGDVAPWSWQANGAWPLVRGQVLHAPTARTSTGTGTAVQLGAVSATQRLYVALHVFSVSGTSSPTLTVAIQSDNAGGFGSPTTVTTLTAATAISNQITRVSGPITDDYFRVSYTITGTNPSFLFAVTAGIAV